MKPTWAEPVDVTAFDPLSPVTPTVGVWGFLSSEIGLGRAARNCVLSLRSAGVDCRAHDIALPGRSSVAFNSDPFVARHTKNVLFVNPKEMLRLDAVVPQAALRDTHRIGSWAWELEAFPKVWTPAFDTVDTVWACSNFVLESLSAATRKPVALAPHPVFDRPYTDKSTARSALKLAADDFIFLSVFDFSSSFQRKNPLAVVDSFKAAFQGERGTAERPLLILKYHSAAANRSAERELKRAVAQDPRILLIPDVMSEAELHLLQDASDCLISLHRSEGFGLNIAEAMLAGSPVIATGYSGNMDFMTETNSYPLPYKLIPVRPGEYFHGEGSVWADVDREATIAALRNVIADRKTSTARGRLARADMLRNFSPEAIGCQLRKLLE